jgi:hypothetical protein
LAVGCWLDHSQKMSLAFFVLEFERLKRLFSGSWLIMPFIIKTVKQPFPFALAM